MTLLNSGIYKILNLINGKFYIGSAIRLNKRFERHRWELDSNRHSNQILQRAYLKYGADVFEFHIVEVIENPTKKLLEEREQFYIDTLKPEYNILPNAGTHLGSKRSEEAKARMSAAQKGRVLSEKALENSRKASAKRRGRKLPQSHIVNAINGRKDHSHSEKTKKKMSLAQKAKSSWPHELGSRCNCYECKERRNSARRIKPQIYIMLPDNIRLEFFND